MDKTCISFDVGIKNLSYCVFKYREKDRESFTIIDWNILDLSRNGTVDVKDIESLICSLIRYLEVLYSQYCVNYMIVENQPVMKNPTMKSIQIAIFTFFVQKKTNIPESKISLYFYSATNKLKVLNLLSSEQKSLVHVDKTKSAYSDRKKQSVQMTRILLECVQFDNLALKELFLASKKQDDLADSFLQGYHFAFS